MKVNRPKPRMAKRPAAASPARASPPAHVKGAKKAKPAQPAAVQPPPDPLAEACAPVLKLLQEKKADVLVAALPHALRQPQESYQLRMLDAIQGLLEEEEAKRRMAVTAAEKELEDEHTHKETAKTKLEEAEAEAASLKARADELAAAVQPPQAALEEAKAEVLAKKAKRDNLDKEQEAVQKEREEYAAWVTELWEPLKGGQVDSAHWRERNKMVAKVCGLLERCSEPQSLTSALEVALKERPAARGEFATKVIDAAEAAFQRRQQELADRAGAFDTEAASRQAAVDEAEAAALRAEAVYNSAVEESIAAQNQWAEQTNVVEILRTQLRHLMAKDHAARLAKAKAELDALLSVSSTFASLREGRKAEEAPQAAAAEKGKPAEEAHQAAAAEKWEPRAEEAPAA